MGGETGTVDLPPRVKQGMQWGMPVMSTFFTLLWPAGLQLGFTSASILALVQSFLFRQPWFRNFLRIHPLPPRAPPASPQDLTRGMTIPTTARTKPQEPEASAEGLVGSVSSKLKRFVEMNQPPPTGGRSKAQIAEAKRYEEKRTREIQREKYEAAQERRRKRFERSGR